MVLGLDGLSVAWVLEDWRQLNQILLFSLPGGPKVIRICSHLRSCLEVGHHCVQSFRKSAIKMISLQFGYTIWRKMVWEGCCQYLLSVWRGRHPNPTQSPSQPSSSGTIPGSKHQVILHYYNVCPVWLMHCLKLCLYQNSTLVLPDNLVRT